MVIDEVLKGGNSPQVKQWKHHLEQQMGHHSQSTFLHHVIHVCLSKQYVPNLAYLRPICHH